MKTKNTKTQTAKKDAPRKRTADPDRKPRKANPWNTTLTIGPNDRVNYFRFQEGQWKILDPQDPRETVLADAIIAHRWFLRLADFAEIAVLRDAVQQDESPPVTMRDVLCPESAEIKSALADCNAPTSAAEQRDRWLAVAFDRADLDKIHKFRKEHERALDRLTKEWALYRQSKAKIDEEVES